MNLHIENQRLRFRINKEELKNLCSGRDVTQQTYMPNQRILNIEISLQTQEPILLVIFEEDSIVLYAKKEAAEALYQSLPSREGLRAEQEIGNKHVLELILEVDIRTQKRKQPKHIEMRHES